MARPAFRDLLGTQDPGLFVIGAGAPRITVKSQQVRALNLLAAVASDDSAALRPARVLVAGGGIAGTTAAAAAGCLGMAVTLVERRSTLMAIQTGSHNRFLHPNVYDWPSEGWADSDARLPVMNWTAAPAGEVVRDLRKKFDVYKRRFDIEVVTNAIHLQVGATTAGSIPVSWTVEGGAGYVHQRFDLAVMCLGFGGESGNTPYWHDDDIHQLGEEKALVSGCGDGGLVDVTRLCLNDFEHGELIDLLESSTVLDEVLEIEASDDPVHLSQSYVELRDPVLEGLLKQRLKARPPVILNGLDEAPFCTSSAPAHRLLVGHLIRLGAVQYVRGPLDDPYPGQGRREVAIGHERIEVDLVIRRHGPGPTPLAQFPDIVQTTPKAGVDDPTRFPHWPRKTYAPARAAETEFKEQKRREQARKRNRRASTTATARRKGWLPEGSAREHARALVALGWTNVNTTDSAISLRRPDGRPLEISHGRRLTRSEVKALLDATGVSREEYVAAWRSRGQGRA